MAILLPSFQGQFGFVRNQSCHSFRFTRNQSSRFHKPPFLIFSSDRQNFCLRLLIHLTWPIEYHRGVTKRLQIFKFLMPMPASSRVEKSSEEGWVEYGGKLSNGLKNLPKHARYLLFSPYPGVALFSHSSFELDLKFFSVSPCLPACRQAGVSPRPSFPYAAHLTIVPLSSEVFFLFFLLTSAFTLYTLPQSGNRSFRVPMKSKEQFPAKITVRLSAGSVFGKGSSV